MTQYTYANMETAIYMAIGASVELELMHPKGYQILADRFSGHTGIMAELIPLAKFADDLLQAAPVEYAPGVWQYEIAEPFGRWWVTEGCPDPSVARAELERMVEEWLQ